MSFEVCHLFFICFVAMDIFRQFDSTVELMVKSYDQLVLVISWLMVLWVRFLDLIGRIVPLFCFACLTFAIVVIFFYGIFCCSSSLDPLLWWDFIALSWLYSFLVSPFCFGGFDDGFSFYYFQERAPILTFHLLVDLGLIAVAGV